MPIGRARLSLSAAACSGSRLRWRSANAAGACSLIDPAPVPRALAASTDISKVVRPDYGPDEVYVDMAETAIAGWREWNARWAPTLYHQDGFLLLRASPCSREDSSTRAIRCSCGESTLVERLDPRTRVERFPAWSPDRYPDGYFNPGAGWAESGKVLERLTADARSRGCHTP